MRRAEIVIDPLAAARIAEFLEFGARDLFVIRIFASQLRPIQALFVDFRGEIDQRRLVGAIVKPVNTQREITPAHARPFGQRLFVEHLVETAQEARHGRNDARIARGLLPLGHGFEQNETRPDIELAEAGIGIGIAFERSKPAIVALCFQNIIYPLLRAGFEIGVIEEDRERNETIEPVRAALPAFGLAADP